MSAIVPGTHSVSESNHVVDHSAERAKLQENLLAAAKQCHARFGGKTELATESDACVKQLCGILEDILSHGLKVQHGTEKFNSALRYLSSDFFLLKLITEKTFIVLQ